MVSTSEVVYFISFSYICFILIQKVENYVKMREKGEKTILPITGSPCSRVLINEKNILKTFKILTIYALLQKVIDPSAKSRVPNLDCPNCILQQLLA